MDLSLDDLVKVTGGSLLQSGECTEFSGVGIDSRTINPGEVFVAVKGSHFDGCDFVSDAVKRGARAVVCSNPVPVKDKISVIRVSDTVHTLGDLAAWWRGHFKAPCIAITGSNGKSTTKEMVSAIVSCLGPVLKTEGNFNNLIGLPLTVFRWEKEHGVAVLEMGMNARGEIRRLTQISRPDVGLITNVTAAHLEKLENVEGVAKAKGELFEEMEESAVAIINDEDSWVKKLGANFKGRKITFGMQNSSDVRFLHMDNRGLYETNLKFSIQGVEYETKLPLPGTHNVMNALAAFSVGLALGIKTEEMIRRIVDFHPMAMRFERVQLNNGVCLVNDSYNANPQSMRAAFRTVGSAKRAGRFIAVLGDMLELGEQSEALHHEVGVAVAEAGAAELFIFGNFAKFTARGAKEKGLSESHVHEYKDIDLLSSAVENEIKAGDVLLIKGSRGMRMERIVEYLKHNIGCG